MKPVGTARTQNTQPKRWLKWALYLFATLLLGIGFLIAVLFWELYRSNGELLTGGQKRAFLLHVPITIPTNRPVPLVICLHGFAEWPAHVMRLSHWNQLADEFGFLVVYPRGSGFPFRWRCSGLFSKQEEQSQDVQFISDLIDYLKKEYNIDEARIYANGLSNGAGMSFLLAGSLSDRIAAMGGVAGAYVLPWTEYNPKRPVPAIIFHGTADPIVTISCQVVRLVWYAPGYSSMGAVTGGTQWLSDQPCAFPRQRFGNRIALSGSHQQC